PDDGVAEGRSTAPAARERVGPRREPPLRLIMRRLGCSRRTSARTVGGAVLCGAPSAGRRGGVRRCSG
ncbi:hypothetical protein ACFRAN_23565, partial [Bacillus subtilis]